MVNNILPPTLDGTRLSADTSGRLLDIIMIQGINFVDRQTTEPVRLAFGDVEQEIAGPQKLIQRWLLAFLTKQGSVQSNPNYGTTFMRTLEQGRIVTDADVRITFSEAAALVTDVLDAVDADKPDDERLESALLVNFNILVDKLEMTIEIVSQAGRGTTIIVPLPLET